jgi:hypothetical protein
MHHSPEVVPVHPGFFIQVSHPINSVSWAVEKFVKWDIIIPIFGGAFTSEV